MKQAIAVIVLVLCLSTAFVESKSYYGNRKKAALRKIMEDVPEFAEKRDADECGTGKPCPPPLHCHYGYCVRF